MNEPTIEQVDVDGAVREAAERASGDSRAGFFAKAAFGAGALVGGGVLLADPERAAASPATDDAILNFALTLEYLEHAFYAQAIAKQAPGKGAGTTFAATAHQHEGQHVKALKSALGSGAIKEPSFDFGDAFAETQIFNKTAIALEDLGVRAYKGQAPNITSPAILKVALSIHTVEANHSAWIRFIAGEDPTYTGAFELPLTKAQVLKQVNATGFITNMS
jgi:hypothetical protein